MNAAFSEAVRTGMKFGEVHASEKGAHLTDPQAEAIIERLDTVDTAPRDFRLSSE